MNADETFEKITQDMMSSFFEKNPDFATALGLHDPYDYLLPKGSTDHIEENLKLLDETIKRLHGTLKPQDLSPKNKIDLEVLERASENWKFFFYEYPMHELNPDAFGDLGGLIFIMLTRDYAPLEKRIDAIASRMEKMPRYLEEFRSRFAESRPVKLWTEIAIETAQSMGGLFQFVAHSAKGKVSAKAYERLSKATAELQPAFKLHVEWLKGLLSKTREDWALGKKRFAKLMEMRDLGMGPDEIRQLGEDYLKKLKDERIQLAKQIAPSKTVDEVQEAIESNSPKTFEEALSYTRKAMEEAKEFIQKNNLATVYPEDALLVTETPAFIAPLLPFAAMLMPARFDKPQIGIYVVTRPKDMSNLAKHLNYSSIRNTAVHEAFPGHFLQGTISNRGSVIRLLAQGTETVEGWAHYCEQMMVEKGFITDLETRFVQINDMIWRAVRIIVDVKLAEGEMGFSEAVAMLEKETGMSKDGAEAEVKRYTQTPGYALSYLLGKHLILKLKEELKKKMGSKFDERFFHDTVTANGYLPISMLRKVFEQDPGKSKTY